MIIFNNRYIIENGDSLTFMQEVNGNVNGTYKNGTITGILEGNVLKATFHNTKANASGLMEITFREKGFDAKWKAGLDPGPMRGKWVGTLEEEKHELQANTNDAVKNGYHFFIDEDGVRYDGEWENDEFILGKIEYFDEDGEKVIEEGTFKECTITSGKITYENGMVWEGDFDEDGVLHGKGKQTYLDDDGGQVIEEGIFEHSYLKEGKVTWADGSSASGTFDEELELNGKGIYSWANGDFQDGTWVNGEFKDGNAKISHDDGEVSEGMMKDGEWVEKEEEIVNIITNGIENYESGSKYEGYFLNSIRHGKGRYTWANGDFYEGDFVDGDFNGEGIINYINGDYKKGIWKDDELIKGEKKTTSEDYEIEISFLENSLLQKQIITSKDIWDQEQISTTLFYYENDILTKKEEENINSKGEINKWTYSYKHKDNNLIEKELIWLKENGDKTTYITYYLNSCITKEKTIWQDGSWQEEIFINPSSEKNGLKEVKINYSDGRKFEGTFDFDNFGFHEGKLSYQNGDYKYGEWVEGEDDFEFYTGSIRKTFKSGNIYEGQVKLGKKTGQGTYYVNNDGEYSGEFLNGKLNGWGKLTKSNGEIIEGKWKNGVLTFSSGDLVSLKSGDLNMTIESINGSSAKCIYVYRGKPTSEFYFVSLLKHIKN